MVPETSLFLDVLSPESRDAIVSQSTEVSLGLRDSLQAQEEQPRYVYFLRSGVASVVVHHAEGATSETLLVGREGVVGSLALLGELFPVYSCFMQVEGIGLRIPIGTMRTLFATVPEIRQRTLQCAQQQAMTTIQIAACNVAHEAESRLARWLLMVQDRTQTETFQLTQEFLAEMLGARRTTVALAAGTLQRSGLIEYTRGRIKILSRADLLSAACECYPVTRRLLQGMYGANAPGAAMDLSMKGGGSR